MEEGINWSPIDYFNNKIVCDVIESKVGNLVCILIKSSKENVSCCANCCSFRTFQEIMCSGYRFDRNPQV